MLVAHTHSHKATRLNCYTNHMTKNSRTLRNKKLLLIPTIVLAAIAGFFIFYIVESTPNFIRAYQIRAADKTATATVESTSSTYVKYSGIGRGNSESKYDTAVVSYKTQTADNVEESHRAKVAVYTPKKGELVTVFYDPSSPGEVTTEAEVFIVKEYWKTVTIFGSIITILAFVALYSIVKGSILIRRK